MNEIIYDGQLKPCKFCGHVLEVEELIWDWSLNDGYSFICVECQPEDD